MYFRHLTTASLFLPGSTRNRFLSGGRYLLWALELKLRFQTVCANVWLVSYLISQKRRFHTIILPAITFSEVRPLRVYFRKDQTSKLRATCLNLRTTLRVIGDVSATRCFRRCFGRIARVTRLSHVMGL